MQNLLEKSRFFSRSWSSFEIQDFTSSKWISKKMNPSMKLIKRFSSDLILRNRVRLAHLIWCFQIGRILGKNGLNLLVNNAGVYHHYFVRILCIYSNSIWIKIILYSNRFSIQKIKLDKYEPEKVEQMFDVNAIGPMILTQVGSIFYWKSIILLLLIW